MYLLSFYQEHTETKIGLFDSIEEGRQLLANIPSYICSEINGDLEESFDPNLLPDYMEIEYKGHIIPLSRYMFTEGGLVEPVWQPLPYFSGPGQGLVDGSTRVDAYSIDNQDLKAYLSQRQDQYQKVADILQKMGYQVDRHFFGSEDGEALVYKLPNDKNWHFFSHLDPSFIDEDWDEKLVKEVID